MRQGKEMDMTKGTPWKQILAFSLPLVIGNLLQQLYAFVDAAIVGRFVGLDALAAIGGTDWVRWAILGVCTDCAMGFGIVASQRIGAGKPEDFKKVMAAGLQFVVVIGIGFTVCMWLLLHPILRLLQTQESIYEDSAIYLWFAIISIPVSLFYNMLCAMLRAAGNSRGPFAAAALASVLNVALDLWFVVGFHGGVLGAAAATLLSQMFAAAFALSFVWRTRICRLTRESWKWDPSLLKETTKLWFPMFWNSIAISAGGVIVQRYINAGGAMVTAGIDAGTKIYSLLESVEKAVCSGISVYVGQNLGAGRLDRIRRGMRSMIRFALLFSAWLSVNLLVFGDGLIGLFLAENQSPEQLREAYGAARIYLNVQCISVFLMVPMHFFRGAVQALGHAEIPLAGAFVQIIARLLTVVLLGKPLGLVGLCLPDGVSAAASLPLMAIPYEIFMRRLEGKRRKGGAEYGHRETG